MNKIKLWDNQHDLSILCIGAHSDDIEIGCGGSILRILDEYPAVDIYWVVFSANQKRKQEAIESAHAFLKKARSKKIIIKDFRDSFFPYIGSNIKDYFKQLQKDWNGNLIFTHYLYDLHQDHRLLSEMTWNTFRDHLILEYEIPKWDGDLDRPNFYFDLKKKQVEEKVSIIANVFKTQTKRDWFNSETFTSLMRIRGVESRSKSKHAEAFHLRKGVF